MIAWDGIECAIKYASDGGIECASKDASDGGIKCAVKDASVGEMECETCDSDGRGTLRKITKVRERDEIQCAGVSLFKVAVDGEDDAVDGIECAGSSLSISYGRGSKTRDRFLHR